MMKRLLPIILVLILACSVVQAASTIYYIDAVNGNDANAGTSSAAAWKTLARANAQTYQAGDQILLKRGCVWQEGAFHPQGSGSAGLPIVLADYGSGALPKIIGNVDSAVVLRNVSYWTVRNLDLTQVGLATLAIDHDSGKDVDQNSDETAKPVLEIRGLNGTVSHIRVENCQVHDGHWNGIFVSGGYYQLDTGVSGNADDIIITGCESYGHHKAGCEITCQYTKTPIYTATNIQILNSIFHDNGGDGVMAGPVQNGLIDHCEAYRNGLLRDARLGLWFWDSKDCVIQFCESHHNTTPDFDSQTRDGGGFDLDLGTENCVIQYCYSHDNTGEGYLLMTWPIGFGYSRGISHNQTLRYCISERDASKLAGSIEIFGEADVWAYNNVIYYVPERSADTVMFDGTGGCIASSIWGKSGKPTCRFYNNVFITDKTSSQNPNAVSNLIWTDGNGTWTFDNNCYYMIEGGVLFQWGGSAINSWSGWQAKGFDTHGMNANPLLTAMTTGPSGCMLQAGSPCINTGMAVTASPRGMGTLDYFGNLTPAGGVYDIGCHEYQGDGGDTQAPTAPTNLSATAVSSSQINLSWTASTDNVGVTGYRIFRDGVQIGTSTGATYADTGLTAGSTYSYYVKAHDAAGNISTASNTADATTQSSGGDTQAPTAPANLSATAVSSSQINLSWTASTDNVGVTGYQIFRGGAQIATSPGTTYADTGLTAGTNYSYYVKAYDTAGNISNPSNTAAATTQSGGGGSTVMHVADIWTCDANGVAKDTFGRPGAVYWKVKIVDESGNAVSGVTVITEIYRPGSSSVWTTKTATTDSAGIAVMSINLVNNSTTGTYTVKVGSVSKSGWTYNSAANVKSQTTFLVQ